MESGGEPPAGSAEGEYGLNEIGLHKGVEWSGVEWCGVVHRRGVVVVVVVVEMAQTKSMMG